MVEFVTNAGRVVPSGASCTSYQNHVSHRHQADRNKEIETSAAVCKMESRPNAAAPFRNNPRRKP